MNDNTVTSHLISIKEKIDSKQLLSVEDCDYLDIDLVHDLHRKYVNSSRVDLLKIFEFGNELASHAEGTKIFLKNGKTILDFTGGIGVLNHGHNHPRILEVRRRFAEMKRMEVHRNYFSQYLSVLIHNLAVLLPGDLEFSFFPNSGSEAVEAGLKTAFKYHNVRRDIILHSDISFHGKLFGAGSVTHSPENHFPFPKIPRTKRFIFNDIKSVKNLIDDSRRSNGECAVAGIIIEPLNVSNMIACTEDFLIELRKICYKEDIVLIFDEVYSGWGKTGALFNFMKYKDVIPDVLCFAKSFGGGKASISGITTRRPIFKKAFDDSVSANLQSTTFYGFGEETVTAIEALNIIAEDDYVGRAQKIDIHLTSGLKKLQEKFPSLIREVRGQGAIHGVFFNSGPDILNKIVNLVPGELFKDPRFIGKLITAAVVSELYSKENILTFTSLGLDIHLIAAPSLVASEEDVSNFIDGLDRTLQQGILPIVLKFVKRKFTS